MDSFFSWLGCSVMLLFPAVVMIAGSVINGRKRRRDDAHAFASAVRRQLGHGALVVDDGKCIELTLPSRRSVLVEVSERSELDENDRPGTATYRREPWGTFAIGVPEAPPVRITRESLATWIGKRLGITKETEIGVREFDDKFLIKTPAGGRAALTLARSQRARAEIERLFDAHGVSQLEVAGGVARIRPAFRLRDLGALAPVLLALDAIVDELERVKLPVKVLGVERHALAWKGNARCSYCHEAVTGEEPDLVACQACSTVLHEACWSEHGRCPVLGCGGTNPERGAATRVTG